MYKNQVLTGCCKLFKGESKTCGFNTGVYETDKTLVNKITGSRWLTSLFFKISCEKAHLLLIYNTIKKYDLRIFIM